MAAVLVAVGGVVARCLPWRFVFTDAGTYFPGVDPYYHLWHARALVEQFPHWSLMDPYLNFPMGAPFPYLTGFDMLVALPGLIGLDPGWMAAWAAGLMPILGGVAVYLTYRLGRALLDPAGGLAAAFLMAFLCGPMNYTMLGRVDHHGAVAPVILLMFLSFSNSLRARTPRAALVWGGLCGMLAGWSVTLWVITPPLYYLPIPLTLLWLCFSGQGARLRPAALAITGSALLMVTVGAGLAGDLAARPFELFLPSGIPILLFALAALWVAVAVYRPLWSLVVPGAVGVLAVLSLGLGLFNIEPLERIASVIGGRATAFAGIVESQPLLSVHGVFTLERAGAFYSHLILFWPLLAGIFIHRTWKAARRDGEEWLLPIYCILGGTLLMLQQRFGEYAAPAMALLLAWALVRATGAVLRDARDPGRRARVGILAAGLIAAVAILAVPLVRGLYHFATRDTSARSRLLADFGRRLSDTTPDPRGANGRLEYGLLSSEEDAVVLLATAGRPVVASSFGLAEIQAHNAEGYRILLAGDEGWAARRLEQLRVRYLVLTPILARIQAMARVAGLKSEFISVTRKVAGPDLRMSVRPRPPFVGSLHTRLLMADGSRGMLWGIEAACLSRFRLHLEAAQPATVLGLRVPAVKAFEMVPGARLTGRAPPGQLARLRLDVRTNIGRRFTYQTQAHADSEGRFEFVVPYATRGGDTPCRAEGPYRIKVGEQVFHVQVTEEAVLRGETLAVSDLSPGAGTTPPSGAGPPPAPRGE